MDRQQMKNARRRRRRLRVRKAVTGTGQRPRLNVFRSLNHIYAQVIDDLSGTTVAAASSRDADLGLTSGGNAKAAEAVGKKIADRAKAAGINSVVFDRNGYLFHGRVKALAEAARKGGLEF